MIIFKKFDNSKEALCLNIFIKFNLNAVQSSKLRTW